ncbi:MAG: hypothetical protein RIS47_929 [Bacteroidota bacterium]
MSTTLKNLMVFALIIAFFSGGTAVASEIVAVKNADELKKAIENAKPGDEIVMANGIWTDIQIRFVANGTKDAPITLRAETQGKVFVEGKSDLKFSGNYLVVSGLYFRNGYTPSGTVIDFRNKSTYANHCRFTNSVIENFNQPRRERDDHWVEFWGRYNQMDHCYLSGKSNSGPTIMVVLRGNESIKNYHQITNNHFGPRPRKGGPHGETIQIGDSFTSMSPCNTTVANNLFEQCNGEVEIISNKSNFNEYRNNVFYKCEGSLVMRHGNYCIIDGNYFIGDDNSDQMGGIRIVNTGHWVTNNYFYNIKGSNFRSALAVMNGIPKSPLNRYNQVTDVVVAYNTWVNCTSPWQFSVGTNVSQSDVLPASEIRSARPIRTIVANNIIYNDKPDSLPIVAYEVIDGVDFKNNIISNLQAKRKAYPGVEDKALGLKKIADNLFVPATDLSSLPFYKGFDFETIATDIFGNKRADMNMIGASCATAAVDPQIMNTKKYGTLWFSNLPQARKTEILVATAKPGDLAAKIAAAKDGDIVQLSDSKYEVSSPLVIDKKITIRPKGKKVKINYTGAAETPAFEMHPKGDLLLQNVILTGQGTQYGFASLKNLMFSLYNLKLDGVEVSNFNAVLRAYKETFANEITLLNTSMKNCDSGLRLCEELDNQGDYNVEFLTIDNCVFDNIQHDVINYYRGGYDESTIGGSLKLTRSTFTNCGKADKSGILVQNRGIVRVDISHNTFKNNSVKLVALLWGAKGNTHSQNLIENSGELKVEENIEQEMVY